MNRRGFFAGLTGGVAALACAPLGFLGRLRAGKVYSMRHATAMTFTIPPNSLEFPVGTTLQLIKIRDGGWVIMGDTENAGLHSARGAQEPSKLKTAEFDSPDPLQSNTKSIVETIHEMGLRITDELLKKGSA